MRHEDPWLQMRSAHENAASSDCLLMHQCSHLMQRGPSNSTNAVLKQIHHLMWSECSKQVLQYACRRGTHVK